MKEMKIANLDQIAESISIDEADEALNINSEEITSDKALEDKGIEKDSKTWKIIKALGKALGKAMQSYTADKGGDLIDELLLGQFKESILSIYKKEKLDSISDEDAQKEYETLSSESKFKQGEERSQLDSRRDENTSSEVDPLTERFVVQWYSKNDDENVGKQLSQLVAEIQKAAQDTEKEQKDLVAKLKSLKVDATDEDMANYGPILAKAVADGNSGEEINKNLKKLKGEVEESCQRRFSQYKKLSLLEESQIILTEDLKQRFILESLVETDQFNEIIYQRMLNEGFFGNILKVAGGVAAGAVVYKVLPNKWKDKVKDFSQKAVKFLTNKTLQGIVSLGGLATSVLTGGWGATLALKAIYAVERHGKVLRNAFERQFTRFANSKGVITSMNFSIKDQKDSKYSMRFYAKDMVWRVLNLKDQLKHPGKDYSKAIVDGEEGKKFRNRLSEIWDPLFSNAKGGKIDFAELFKQAKNVDIPEKAMKAFQDFAENYDKIKENCIDSPKIDTRTQELSKEKIDK